MNYEEFKNKLAEDLQEKINLGIRIAEFSRVYKTDLTREYDSSGPYI